MAKLVHSGALLVEADRPDEHLGEIARIAKLDRNAAKVACRDVSWLEMLEWMM